MGWECWGGLPYTAVACYPTNLKTSLYSPPNSYSQTKSKYILSTTEIIALFSIKPCISLHSHPTHYHHPHLTPHLILSSSHPTPHSTLTPYLTLSSSHTLLHPHHIPYLIPFIIKITICLLIAASVISVW